MVEAGIQSGEQDIVLKLEVAACEKDKIRGLKGRRYLEPDTGLVMLFDPPYKISLWMKDTLIPLDILFVDGAHQIIGFRKSAAPGSLALIDAPRAVAAVIELNAGFIEFWQIQLGDKLWFQPGGDNFAAECSG